MLNQFRVRNESSLGQTIMPARGRTLGVVFRPTLGETKTVTVVIPSNAPDQPQVQVSLIGTGTDERVFLAAYRPTRSLGIPMRTLILRIWAWPVKRPWV